MRSSSPSASILTKSGDGQLRVASSLSRLVMCTISPAAVTKRVEFARTAKDEASDSRRSQRATLSSRRQDLIDQPIARCFERIDESDSCQFKAILEVLGEQMTNAAPLCAAAHKRIPERRRWLFHCIECRRKISHSRCSSLSIPAYEEIARPVCLREGAEMVA